MRPATAVAVIVAVGLSACVRYIEAPARDPIQALRDPVSLESVSRIERHGDVDSIRFRFIVRAPRDTAIVLALAPSAANKLLTTGGTIRPVIEFVPRTAGRESSLVPATLTLRTRLGAGSDSSMIQIAPSDRDTTIVVSAAMTSRPTGALDLRINWYRIAQSPGQAGALDLAPTAVSESRLRTADVTTVSLPLTLAAAIGAIIGFFLVTTK